MSLTRFFGTVVVGVPLLIVGTCCGYQLTHLGLLVQLGPEYGYPAEPGDSLVISRPYLLFPGVFGNAYVPVRPFFVSWKLDDRNRAIARMDHRTLRLLGGGEVTLSFRPIPPLRLRSPHTDEFAVTPEPIASIALSLANDTVVAGDTLRLRVEIRGVSGNLMRVRPMFLWPGGVRQRDPDWEAGETVVRGLAQCAGADSVGVWVGHHMAMARFVVLPHPQPLSAEDLKHGWNPVTGNNEACSWGRGWGSTVATSWSSLCTARGGRASPEASCRDWRFRPSESAGTARD